MKYGYARTSTEGESRQYVADLLNVGRVTVYRGVTFGITSGQQRRLGQAVR